MKKRGIKKSIILFFVRFAATFALLSFVARKLQKKSLFSGEEKNPMEGKRVVFAEDDNAPLNADGKRGHLFSNGSSRNRHGIYQDFFKRGADLVLSFGALVLLAPLFGLISLAVFLNNPGPVFFTQKRVGQNKQFFKMHKFRSMKMNTPKDVPTHMLENSEQYITKVGGFLRKHSLDELPQLWDIFVGNMSFVGPRPALWNQDVLVAERDKYKANDVKPGLTGWAQINGRDVLTIEEKALLDGEYVKKLGICMDVKCLAGSFKVFFKDSTVLEGKKGERNFVEGKSDSELIGNVGFGSAVEIDKSSLKRILVTGAGSYIGESFRDYAGKYYPNLSVDTLDMENANWREKSFFTYDIVYHVAGIAHSDIGKVDESIEEKYYAVNTDLAVETCKKAKIEGVKEFIFMSSMVVYGDAAPVGKRKVIDGNTVPMASNIYGDSKLRADVAVRDLADDNFKVIVLRPPMIYGKESRGNYRALEKIAEMAPFFPDIKNERSMLYIDNFCEFLCKLMSVKKIERDSVVLFPQNGEWSNTSKMIQKIGLCFGKDISLLKVLSPVVFMGSRMPGRIGKLVNKAFGSLTYDKELSCYEGLGYQKTGLFESIEKTEGLCETLKRPLISVVTVSLDSEKTIRNTIESVLNQTYDNVEYLIIDGMSKDNTVNIAREYEDAFFKRGISYRIVSESDSGIYDAMNKGIAYSHGGIVGIINSDDRYEADALQEVADIYEKTGFEYFYGDVRLLKSDGSSIVKHSRKDLIVTSRHWNHPGSFVRRSLYDELGGFVCDGIHDDFEFFLRVRRAGKKTVILNKVIAEFAFGGISNEMSFSKAVKRINDRYKCYRKNGYSSLYLIECIVTEIAKYILNRL